MLRQPGDDRHAIPEALGNLIDQLEGDPDDALASVMGNWLALCYALAGRYGFCQVWISRIDDDNTLLPVIGTGVLTARGCRAACARIASDGYVFCRDVGEHGLYRLWRLKSAKCGSTGMALTCTLEFSEDRRFILSLHGPERLRHPRQNTLDELAAIAAYLKRSVEPRSQLPVGPLQRALRNSPVPVFLANRERRIVWTNHALQRLCRLSETPLVGERFDTLDLHCGETGNALSCSPLRLRPNGDEPAESFAVQSVTPLHGNSEAAEAYLGVLQGERNDLGQDKFDGLTGLMERSHFLGRLRSTLSGKPLNDQRCALLFLDLDRFKEVNDRHGHVTGDHLLSAVGERLRQCLRGIDQVARYGGDEFVVLATDIHDENAVQLIAERILSTFAKPFAIDDLNLSIGISIGIAHFPDDADSHESLIRCADTAMYAAKSAKCGFRHYRMTEPRPSATGLH